MKRNLLFLFMFFFLFFGCRQKQEDISANTISGELEALSVSTKDSIFAKNTDTPPLPSGKITSTVMLRGIKKVNINSQNTGEIVLVNARLGKKVKAQEVLVSLENSVQQAELQQAKGAVEEAEISFSASKRLFEQNSISRAEFVRNQNILFAAQTKLAAAQIALKNTRISAPFAGIITMQSEIVQKGNIISADAPLFTIVDVSKIKAIISLNENEIASVKNGLKVLLSVSAAKVETWGEITAVSQGIDSQSGMFSVEAEFENPDLQIKDGMNGEILIYTDEKGGKIANKN